MDTVATKDRRIFARFATSLPLQYVSSSSRIKGAAQAIDISANGLGIYSNKGLPVHIPLEVWLDVPDADTPFHTSGEVAWVQWVWFRQYRIGVVFNKVDLMGISQTLQKIKAFSSCDEEFPSLSKWERLKLRFVYYKSVLFRALNH